VEPSYDASARTATLKLVGDLNMETAERLKTVFKEITDKGYFSVVLDFQDVKIIKSVCIGLLVSVHKTVAANGGSVRVVKTSPNVRKIFEITRLIDVLNVS
jgi:anti-sigma B factor antagonist